MEKAIREFGQRLRGGAVGLFYYAGHGVQVKGENYLIPISANVADEADVKYELVSAGFVLDEMANAGNRLNMMILDACRNNPFGGRGLRSASSGLAQVTAPAGTVISYATQPGNVALDGTARNSPFTTALVKAMRKPGQGVFETFNDVGLMVKTATGGKQQPWLATSPIEGGFQFVPAKAEQAGVTTQPAAAPTADPVAIELSFWDSIKGSTLTEDFKAYLEQYPNGRFAGLARNRLVGASAPPQVALALSPPKTTQQKPLAESIAGVSPGTVFRDCDECPEMVAIPTVNNMTVMSGLGGRAIKIPGARAVGKFEVTFEQWDACVMAGGCNHLSGDQGWGRGNRPVIDVNWDDAKQYTAWLTKKTGKAYRLLTDTEWNYAARAGTTTAYYWGDSDADICQYANVAQIGKTNGCGTGNTSPVGERKPNAFGLYDMLGNVMEWTEDCLEEQLESGGGAGSGKRKCRGRVTRGGSFNFFIYTARRMPITASERHYFVGFRVARTQ